MTTWGGIPVAAAENCDGPKLRSILSDLSLLRRGVDPLESGSIWEVGSKEGGRKRKEREERRERTTCYHRDSRVVASTYWSVFGAIERRIPIVMMKVMIGIIVRMADAVQMTDIIRIVTISVVIIWIVAWSFQHCLSIQSSCPDLIMLAKLCNITEPFWYVRSLLIFPTAINNTTDGNNGKDGSNWKKDCQYCCWVRMMHVFWSYQSWYFVVCNFWRVSQLVLYI